MKKDISFAMKKALIILLIWTSFWMVLRASCDSNVQRIVMYEACAPEDFACVDKAYNNSMERLILLRNQ
jgi:hypothetical protein